jgi:hypothetical protein
MFNHVLAGPLRRMNGIAGIRFHPLLPPDIQGKEFQ